LRALLLELSKINKNTKKFTSHKDNLQYSLNCAVVLQDLELALQMSLLKYRKSAKKVTKLKIGNQTYNLYHRLVPACFAVKTKTVCAKNPLDLSPSQASEKFLKICLMK